MHKQRLLSWFTCSLPTLFFIQNFCFNIFQSISYQCIIMLLKMIHISVRNQRLFTNAFPIFSYFSKPSYYKNEKILIENFIDFLNILLFVWCINIKRIYKKVILPIKFRFAKESFIRGSLNLRGRIGKYIFLYFAISNLFIKNDISWIYTRFCIVVYHLNTTFVCEIHF